MNNCCVIVPAAVQPTSDTSDRMARFSAHVVVILFLNSLKWEISLLAWRRLRSLSQTFCDVVIHVTGKILQGIWTETRRQHKPMIFLDVGLTARRWIAAQLISTHTHTNSVIPCAQIALAIHVLWWFWQFWTSKGYFETAQISESLLLCFLNCHVAMNSYHQLL